MTLIRKNWYRILSILIVLVALAFRTIQLDQLPPSMYWEEVALGYDAYSISQTLSDHHGHFLPIVAFESFGDYKPSLYFYAIVPFIKLLGLNVWAVRLPSALAGVLIVIGVWQLALVLLKDVYQKEKLQIVSLIAMLVTAISPWAIQFSRGGWEVNLATCLVLWGMVLGLKSVLSKKITWQFILAEALLILSMYTYHATRIIAPLLGLSLIVVYYLQFTNFRLALAQLKIDWKILILVLLTGLLSLPLLISMSDKAVSQRFAETSIFSDLDVIVKSNQLKELAGNSFISKIIYHRYVMFGKLILQNFLSHFSLNFLFISGDANPRHSIGYMGLFYHIEALFLVWGTISIWLKKNKNVALLLLFWLIVGIIPASISQATPHALRILPTLPIWMLLISLGVVESFEFILLNAQKLLPKFKLLFFVLFTLIFLAVYLIEVMMWLRFYTKIYPVKYQSEWQYGYEQMVVELNDAWSIRKDLPVYIVRTTGRPAMYYWFFSQTDPRLVQQAELTAKKDQAEFLEFENMKFINGVGEIKGANPLVVLFGNEELPENIGHHLFKEVKDLSGQVVWRIYQVEN